jgi:hypothetical protein
MHRGSAAGKRYRRASMKPRRRRRAEERSAFRDLPDRLTRSAECALRAVPHLLGAVTIPGDLVARAVEKA